MLIMTPSRNSIPPEIHQFKPVQPYLKPTSGIDEIWKLETIDIIPPEKTKNDDRVMEHFINTVIQENGRYQVAWPWRNEEISLPENYELNYGRLKSLHKQLMKVPDMLCKYENIIKEQHEKGIIERVDEKRREGETKHYIPDHAVFTPAKDTTKIRIVYDASAKTKKTNLSLNKCLYRRPVILQNLCGLLLRFRMKRIRNITDIEKAFLQVVFQLKERDVTRFLWLKDIKQPASPNNPVTYRFTRIPFGFISSPFLLGATNEHHLTPKYNQPDHNLSEDFYVDNLINGADNMKEAVQLYSKAKMLFLNISMNLRDRNSNSPELNRKIAEQNRI